MKVIIVVMAVAVAQLVTGCAHDVGTRYSGKVPGDTGTVVVKFSEAVGNASITINEKEVCTDARTKRVTIQDVPAGRNILHVVASDTSWEKNIDKKQEIQVQAGQKMTVQITTPAQGTGYWIYTTVVVGVVLLFVLLM